MVSIKVLLVASCLVAAGSCTVLPFVGGVSGDDAAGALTGSGGGGLLGGILGPLFQGLGKKLDVILKGVLPDLLALRVPAVLDDVLDIVNITGKVLGKILNSLIPGLGSILEKLIVSISKIATCLLGSSGLTGKLLGDQPGKFKDPVSCDGLDGFRGSGSGENVDWQGVFQNMGMDGINDQIGDLVDQCTNNGATSIDDLPAGTAVILKNLQQFGAIFNSNDFSKDQCTQAIKHVIIILGAVANNKKDGAGTKVINVLVPAFDKALEKSGYPTFSSDKDSILDQVNSCKQGQLNFSSSSSQEDSSE